MLPLFNEINKLVYERAYYLKCFKDDQSVPIHFRPPTVLDSYADFDESGGEAAFKSSTNLIVHQGNLASSMSIANRSTHTAHSTSGAQLEPTSSYVKSKSHQPQHQSANSLSNGSQQQLMQNQQQPSQANNVAALRSAAKIAGNEDPALTIIKNILK